MAVVTHRSLARLAQIGEPSDDLTVPIIVLSICLTAAVALGLIRLVKRRRTPDDPAADQSTESTEEPLETEAADAGASDGSNEEDLASEDEPAGGHAALEELLAEE